MAHNLRMANGYAEYRPGVREKLGRVRSELDDWYASGEVILNRGEAAARIVST